MSGVATNILRRSRSLSFSSAVPLLSSSHSGGVQSAANNCGTCGTKVSADSRMKSVSTRSLHCSILHPRAPKIRHLNASHALLIDLDKHIAKVQELEYKVSELEARIAEREALKQALNSVTDVANPDPQNTNRITESLVSEEDRIKFQNRLNEARKRAEQLSQKTNQTEANILRSWHSKRLKEVLDTLSNAYNNAEDAATPLLLAAPSNDIDHEENRIFDALNALVGMANEEARESSNHLIEDLKNLVIERENLKLVIEGTKAKLTNATNTAAECQLSLNNIGASVQAIRYQLKSSQTYLMGSLLKRQQSSPAALWIYGPNPIFTGLGRINEINASIENTALEQALLKTELSHAVAEKNLAFAQKLVRKYKIKVMSGNTQLSRVEAEIERQIGAINDDERQGRAQAGAIVDAVCSKKARLDMNNNGAALEDCGTVMVDPLSSSPTRMND